MLLGSDSMLVGLIFCDYVIQPLWLDKIKKKKLFFSGSKKIKKHISWLTVRLILSIDNNFFELIEFAFFFLTFIFFYFC